MAGGFINFCILLNVSALFLIYVVDVEIETRPSGTEVLHDAVRFLIAPPRLCRPDL